MTKHTPTPWRVFKTTDGRKLVGIGGQDGQGILDCGFGVWSWMDAEGIANAEMVVKAVNNHDALVNALRNCRNRLKMDLEEVEHLRGWLSKSELAERAVQDEAADDADRQAISDADELLAAVEASAVNGDRSADDASSEVR